MNEKKLLLFNGQIITLKKIILKNEIIKFEQINIDLSDLNTSTIKKPKLQETSTLKLLDCFFSNTFANQICNNKLKGRNYFCVNRRLFLPLYSSISFDFTMQLIGQKITLIDIVFLFIVFISFIC